MRPHSADHTELLSERRPIDRLADYAKWRRGQVEWLLRTRLRGQRYPQPVVVLTTSRSGSTWFCEAMSQALRVGRIPEHLRPHHLQRVNDAQEPTIFLRSLISETRAHIASRHSGGTKIIWDDVPGILALQSPNDLVDWLQPLNELNPLWIRLVRQDRVAQAVSRYRAANTGVFHHFTGYRLFAQKQPQVAESRPDPEQLRYDFDRIYQHYAHLSAAENHLDEVINSVPWDVRRLVYEEVSKPPFSDLSHAIAAAASISVEAAGARINRIQKDMNLAMTRSKVSQELTQQFSADLTASEL